MKRMLSMLLVMQLRVAMKMTMTTSMMMLMVMLTTEATKMPPVRPKRAPRWPHVGP